MADLTITAANVVPGSDATLYKDGVAGETITAGMSVYIKATDGKVYKAKCSGLITEAAAKGIALNGGTAGQPIVVQTNGTLNIGATVAAGVWYFVSPNYGGICPAGDVVSTEYSTTLCYGISTTQVKMQVFATGITL